ncbi:MAG: M48 family metalloprotease [Acidobacteria bacterium]|nr:M48 family metalloprotease [Acidobacteriota bacterium]MBI3425251.1 M48 family metalloprotease [Acidobacteriota bacterium]
MCKPITFAAAFILAATITIAAQPLTNVASNVTNNKRAELPEGAEAANAVARLGDLSPAVIRERLAQLRPQAYLADAAHVSQLVKAQNLSVANSKRVDQLKAALQPVLAYHGRSQMPIFVLWSDQPKAYLVERTVIIITNRLMISASDEEIHGIVAHELAHEYVWNERSQAHEASDGKLMRECELFCDVVAAFTLKEIGDDPASYGRILERMTIIGSIKGSATNKESETHPSLDARKKLNKFLCQRLD